MFRIALHWGGTAIVMENNLNIVEAGSAKTVMEKLQYNWKCWVWTLIGSIDSSDKTAKTTEGRALVLTLADKCDVYKACLNR